MAEPPLRKRRKWMRAGNRPDPCRWLPEEVLCRVTSFLDARSLLNFGASTKYYHRVCLKNQAGWDNLCRTHWKSKVYVAPDAQRLLREPTNETAALRAYRVARDDAAIRQFVRKEDICYDLNPSAVWSFRFKESAGSDWTSVDPWFNGEPCREMVFYSDGSVKQFIADDADSFKVVGMSKRRGHFADPPFNGSARQGRLMDPPVTMTWRFVTRPMDLPRRAEGSYIRFTVAGREVPTYSVRRSPNGNWGFIMESCWGLYASFPLPPRKRRRLLRRTAAGEAAWIREEEDDDETDSSPSGEGDQEQNQASGGRQRSVDVCAQQQTEDDPLQDDSQMLITNEVQWREAFLYNAGARILPEGEQATEDFDRAWGGF